MIRTFGKRRFGERDREGWGRHGSNRWHFIPSLAHISRGQALIRERWDEITARERREKVAV